MEGWRRGAGGGGTATQKNTEQLSRAQSDITELAQVVNDLAKAQTSAAVTDATHTKTLEDIQRRLLLLETRR